jgi:hypothetical protein
MPALDFATAQRHDSALDQGAAGRSRPDAVPQHRAAMIMEEAVRLISLQHTSLLRTQQGSTALDVANSKLSLSDVTA